MSTAHFVGRLLGSRACISPLGLATVLLTLCCVSLWASLVSSQSPSVAYINSTSSVVYATPYIAGLTLHPASNQSIYAVDLNGIRAVRIDTASGAVTSYIAQPSLRRPRSVTVDSANNVWVADNWYGDGGRVVVFAHDGTQLREYAWDSKALGTRTYESIVADGVGHIYQSAYNSTLGYHILRRDETSGQVVAVLSRSLCVSAGGAGQEAGPLYVDRSHRVYWLYQERPSSFSNVSYLCRLNVDGSVTALPGPLVWDRRPAVAVDSAGSFAFQLYQQRLYSTQLNSSAPSSSRPASYQETLAVDDSSNMYFVRPLVDSPYPSYNLIDLIPSDSAEQTAAVTFNVTAVNPASTGAFYLPKRVAVDSRQHLYVVDADTARAGHWNWIVRVDGTSGAATGRINTTLKYDTASVDDDWALKMDSRDRLYYLPKQESDDRVLVFSTDGELIHAIECASDLTGGFGPSQHATGLFIDLTDDSVFVSTPTTLYQLDSSWVQQPVAWNITTLYTRFFAVDQARSLLYTRTPNPNFDSLLVQYRLSPDGTVQQLGVVRTVLGSLLHVSDVAIDRTGLVYVLDDDWWDLISIGVRLPIPRVVVLDSSLNPVAAYTAPSGLNLVWYSLALDAASSSLYVVDMGGINVFPAYHSVPSTGSSSSSSSGGGGGSAGGRVMSSSSSSSSSTASPSSSTSSLSVSSSPSSSSAVHNMHSSSSSSARLVPSGDGSSSSISVSGSSSGSSSSSSGTGSSSGISASSGGSGGSTAEPQSDGSSSNSAISPVVAAVIAVLLLAALVVVVLVSMYYCCGVSITGSLRRCCAGGEKAESDADVTSVSLVGDRGRGGRRRLLDVDGYEVELGASDGV